MYYFLRKYDYPEKVTIEIEREGQPSEYLKLHPLNRGSVWDSYFISWQTWLDWEAKFIYYVIKKDDLKSFIATIKAGKKPTGKYNWKKIHLRPFFLSGSAIRRVW